MTKSRYITIQEWMLELGIGGNDLLAYALVYGFCQNGTNHYEGSYEYIARWLGCEHRTVRRIVAKLVEAGLFYKEEHWKNGVKFCDLYALVPDGQNVPPPDKMSADFGQNDQRAGDKMSHHNNNRDNKKRDNNPPVYNPPFDFLQALLDAGVSAETANAWLAVRKAKRCVNTALAWKETLAEIRKSGRSAEECIRECVIRSWGGFKAEWLAREEAGTRATRPDKQSGTAYMLEQMERRMARQRTGYDINDLPDEQ